MDSTDLFYSNCGCLHSERSSTMKEILLNSPQGIQVNSHSYSHTSLQKVSNADSLKTIFLSKESIHVVKLNIIRKRMLISLNGIRGLLGDQPQPDGEEDLKRRQQRAVEFSSRFGRNYLYPLQRQMNTIVKLWKNLQIKRTHSAFFTLCQKVIAAHQNAQSALQAYLHHIPSSVEKGTEKLQELLQVVHNLCSNCSMLGMSEEESDFSSQSIKQQCQMLMMEVQKRAGDEKEKKTCNALSLTCSQKDIALNSKKENTTQRFSMYSKSNYLKSSRPHNKKKATKIPVTSKNKSSKLHFNKQALKETVIPHDLKRNQLAKTPVHKTYEKNVEDNHEIGEVCANDDVKTMMEFIIPEEVPKCTVASKIINSDRSASFQKELERINSQNSHSSFQKEIKRTDSKLHLHQKKIDKKFPATPNMSTLRKLEYEIKNLKKQAKHLKEIGHPNYPIYLKTLEIMSWQLTSLKERICHSDEYSCSDVSNTFHKPKQMETTKEVRSSLSKSEFPKNVKLICLSRISDEECFHERDLLENNIENSDNVESTLQEDMCLETVECKEKRKNYSQRSKMNGKPQDAGSGKYVKLTLSHSEVLSAVAHQQAFQEHIYSSSLYNELLKPWLIVERLGNNLIDNVLQEIIMNDTGIQKITSGLLHLEFQ